MKTFYAMISNKSSARGYNQTITVYRIIKNQPVFVGKNDRINTASSVGERAESYQIISKNTDMKMRDKYNLVEEINLFIFEG